MNKTSTEPLSEQLAKQFRAVYYGGNWTAVNLKDTLTDVDWQQALTRIDSVNSIAALVFHMNYYVAVVLKVMQGEPLNASDRFSFDLPVIDSPAGWSELVNKTFDDAETFACKVEEMADSKLFGDFEDGKYGSYYRNISGITEHAHYHLGQIVVIKKLLKERP